MAGFRPRFFLEPEDGRPDRAACALGREDRHRAGDLSGREDSSGRDDPRGGEDPYGGRDLSGCELELGPEDSHHATRVLRLRPGDACEVVMGAAVYAAAVAGGGVPVKVRLTARLVGSEEGARYRCRVGIVQALARPSLVDYVLEKGTEVGASFFILVSADGSSRASGRRSAEQTARWRRIVLGAAKQSKQVVVPSVAQGGSVDEALSLLCRDEALSLALQPGTGIGLGERLEPLSSACPRVALWVGPEGGWSTAESALFEARGVEAVRLGRSVLRTETAGPVGVAVARLALRDW